MKQPFSRSKVVGADPMGTSGGAFFRLEAMAVSPVERTTQKFFAADLSFQLRMTGSDTGVLRYQDRPLVDLKYTDDSIWLAGRKWDGGEQPEFQVKVTDCENDDDLRKALDKAYNRAVLDSDDVHWSMYQSHERFSEATRAANPFITPEEATSLAQRTPATEGPGTLKDYPDAEESRDHVHRRTFHNLAENPATPDEGLRVIAERVTGKWMNNMGDGSDPLLAKVANNPNASVETLNVLADHRDQSVRSTARDRLKGMGQKPPRRRLRDVLLG